MKGFDSHCRSAVHCPTCRDHVGGRSWRRSLADCFGITDIDFKCPFGKSWGYQQEWTPDQPSRGLGDAIAKITRRFGIKPCGGCKERQEWANEKVPYNQARIGA